MDNNNDLTAKVSGWLRQYGLCPGEQGENGWTEVYYDGVLFEYDVMDDKVCFTFSAQIPDGDMEDMAKAAFELMENSKSVQIYLEGKEYDIDGDSIILRVWVHELSDYGRFVQEFRFKMDQCVACYLKICGMPVFNGETEGKEETSDSDARDENLKEKMRQIEAYLKEKEIEYKVIDQRSIAVRRDEEGNPAIIDVSDGLVSLSMMHYFPKEIRDVLAHAAFRAMRQTVGQWIVREADDCMGVLYDVEIQYYEEDDEQAFIDKLAYLLIAYVDSTDVFTDTLRSHLEEMENVPESTVKDDEGADIDAGIDENVKTMIVTALREAGYSPTVEDGIHFQWQGRDYLVKYSNVWTVVGLGMYLPKDIGDFHALSSYLFEVMSQCRVKLSIEEDDCDNDRWAVGISVEIPIYDLNGMSINSGLLVVQEVCGALLEHFGLCADDEDEEKSAAVCDFVFNCLMDGGYSPETVSENNLDFLINNAQYVISVFPYPDRNRCTITSAMENRTGYEFTKEVNAAFTLISHNTDVTVSRLESDDDGYEHYYLSETLMLSDDKEKFLSDLKLCLEDLDRCTDFFIDRLKQQ